MVGLGGDVGSVCWKWASLTSGLRLHLDISRQHYMLSNRRPHPNAHTSSCQQYRTMRLRLRVERHTFPPTQALWPVADPTTTVAQFLHAVNDIFPLEGNTWGLEDYRVSIAGYELLHYHALEAVCKDEDEVVIQPLRLVDLRARTLAGRNQISGDGRHLHDGVPFGRPCLRRPLRPEIHIPPRKRRRLLDAESGGEQDEEAGRGPQLMISNGGEEDLDSEDEADGDFTLDEAQSDGEAESDEDDGASADESSSASENDAREPLSSVQSEASSSDKSASESDSESHSTSSDSGSTSGSSDSGSSKAKMPNGTSATLRETKSNSKDASRSKEREIRPATQNGGPKSKAIDQTEPGGSNLDPSLVVDRRHVGIPGAGKPETKYRNQRRRESRKLKRLVATNRLPPNSTFDHLHAWEAQNPTADLWSLRPDHGKDKQIAGIAEKENLAPVTSNVDAKSHRNLTKTSQHVLPRETSTSSNTKTAAQHSNVSSETLTASQIFEMRRQELLNAIANGGVDVEAQTVGIETPEADGDGDAQQGPEELSSKQIQDRPLGCQEATDLNGDASKVLAFVPSSVTRRARLDIASSQRMLFSSLGVRTPKNEEEKATTRQLLANQPKRDARSIPKPDACSIPQAEGDAAKGPIEETLPRDEDSDPEAWRSKIMLRAVECCEEGIALSTPPFPFRQRWDPQQRRGRRSQRNRGTGAERGKRQQTNTTNRSDEPRAYADRKRKWGKARQSERPVQEWDGFETYDKYNPNGCDALDYDEQPTRKEEQPEQYDQWGGKWTEDGVYDSDPFAPIPTDIDSLPVLTHDEAVRDDLVVYRALVCDESTGWQPDSVTRSVRILSPNPAGGDVVIRIALCDLQSRRFDDNGDRVYGRFEMPGVDDEDYGDDRVKKVAWQDLGDVRLITRIRGTG